MAKRLTTADFLERAKAVHGNRYDYSDVEYVKSTQNVAINCPDHGTFWQTPNAHFVGKGCKSCAAKGRGLRRRLTSDEFIRNAKVIHGDRYDYSEVRYVDATTNVTIICREHGEFPQRPANHTIGYGCPECGGNKPLMLEKFVERASKVHGARYDYSRVELKNVENKVEILCPNHGSFFQRPMSHLRGFGCDRCGRVETGTKLCHTLKRFIADARRAHGGRYDYSQVEYVNALTSVTIVCPKHGSFIQKPASHIRGIGCSKCGDERTAAKRTRTTEDWVAEAKKIYGNRYDYSRVDYKTSHEKIEIICAEHGSFRTLPHNHTRRMSGCPNCAESGFNPSKPGILYYIAVMTNDDDTRYKIGITNLSIEKRFPAPDRARIRVVKMWRFAVGRRAEEREAEILFQFSGDRYYGPKLLVGAGNTEIFTHDVLGLDWWNDERGAPIVDEDATLTSRPVQRDLSF